MPPRKTRNVNRDQQHNNSERSSGGCNGPQQGPLVEAEKENVENQGMMRNLIMEQFAHKPKKPFVTRKMRSIASEESEGKVRKRARRSVAAKDPHERTKKRWASCPFHCNLRAFSFPFWVFVWKDLYTPCTY